MCPPQPSSSRQRLQESMLKKKPTVSWNPWGDIYFWPPFVPSSASATCRVLLCLSCCQPGLLAALGVGNEQLQTSLPPHYSASPAGISASFLLSRMLLSKSHLSHCWTEVDFRKPLWCGGSWGRMKSLVAYFCSVSFNLLSGVSKYCRRDSGIFLKDLLDVFCMWHAHSL